MFEISATRISNEFFTYSIIIILTATIITWMLQFHWSRRGLYRSVANMDSLPALPFVGHCYLLFNSSEKILNHMCELSKVHKAPLKIWLGPYLYVGILQPEYLATILNHPKALGKDKLYNLTKDNSMLLNAPVDVWKKHRKMISPSFNQKILNSFIEIFEKNSKMFTNAIEEHQNNKEFNIYPYLVNSTLHSIIETVFGSSGNSQDDISNYMREYSRMLQIIIQRTKNIFYYLDTIYYRSKLGKEHKKCLIYLKTFALQIIHSRLKEYKNNNMNNKEEILIQENDENSTTFRKKPKVLLDLLIEHSEGDGFTKKQLLRETNGFIIAGSDTSALGVGFALMMLGMHPDIQDNVYAELNHIFGSSDRSITVDDLSSMHYTEMVIKETLRLFPSGPIILREASGDIQLDDEYKIPSKSGIIISILSLHRKEELWPEPLKFDPERFSPENITNRHPYSYIPFSGGSRNCIGYRYAMMAMKVLIATFVRKYKVHCPYKCPADIRLTFEITLKPIEGHMISIERRNVNQSKLHT